MKLFFLFLLLPLVGNAQLQLPDTLLHKVRGSTEKYSISYDNIPIVGSTTLPCLEVKINGKAGYKFLIDLGSNVVLFRQNVVEETGMTVLADRAASDIVKADKLEIGNSIFMDVHGGAYKDLDVDGVIGFNLLSKENFCIDYPNMLFSFINTKPPQKDSAYVPYELIGRMPYIQSKIGNKSFYINFDTGADSWLYFPLNLKDSFQLMSAVKQYKETSNNQTGKAITYTAQIKDDVVFGNYTIVSPHIIFDPNIEDIYVGSSLLNAFKLTFYTKASLVKMERAEKGNLIVIPESR